MIFKMVHWLRQNLFNGLINSILTLIVLAGLLSVLVPVLQWVFIDGEWGEFRLKWKVILFGYYPDELVWRPVLVFALLGLVILPFLFQSSPRWLRWVVLAYPFLAYWLLFGRFGLEPILTPRIGGVLLLLILTIASNGIAFVVGVALTLGRKYAILPLRLFSIATIAVFHSIPLIVLFTILFVFSILAVPLGYYVDFLVLGMLVLSLPTTVKIAHILSKELDNIPSGQGEAAMALGLGPSRSFWLVTFLQAVQNGLPDILLAFAGLVRNVSILSLVGFLEPLDTLLTIQPTLIYERLVLAALIYGLLSFGITALAKKYERRLARQREPFGRI